MRLMFLDYGKPDPFGEIIGRSRALAWPVNAFRVTLPIADESGDRLNAFERVVLKLIAVGGIRDPERLAEETCLPSSLIHCALLRLRDRGIIDEGNGVIERGREILKTREEESSTFVSALFFRETVAGKLLPFFHRLDENNPLKKKERKGEFRDIREDARHKRAPLEPRDVLFILRMARKRAQFDLGEMVTPAEQKIMILGDPESYLLDCPIAILKVDGEFRIANPFGGGFSLMLESAFERLLEQDDKLADWLMKWKQDLSNPSRIGPGEMSSTRLGDGAAHRYPNLFPHLIPRRNMQHLSIEQIYAALEWSLFYACALRPNGDAVMKLKFSGQSPHSDLLRSAAEKIGLEPPKLGFREIPGGRILDFLSGKAEMWTVLSLSILLAEKDASHPLRRIAARRPGFIPEILAIKSKRDNPAHGKGRTQKNEYELPEEGFMRETLETLLPGLRLSGPPIVNVDQNVVADLRLDARANVQNEFGFELFNRLGPDLQNRLIQAEFFWLECGDGDDALAFVCDLYAALQAVFAKRQVVRSPAINHSAYAECAAKKLADADLGDLPDSLRGVKSSLIQKTLLGEPQTLGACVMAFLLASTDEDLRLIAAGQPTFIHTIDAILKLRGHGNAPTPLSRNAIGKLRKSVYSIVKAMLEI